MTRLQTLGLFFLLTLSILSQADAATMTWLNTSVSVPETLVFSRDGKILPVRVTSDKIGGFGFFPREDIEWGLNCIFAFGIGMLSAMILFALKAFEISSIYRYYRLFWLFTLTLLSLFNFMKHQHMFNSWETVLVFLVFLILFYLATVAPATYQYRKKAGIARMIDTLLYGAAIILYGWSNYLLFSGVWSEHKHLWDW